jgi:hypothetical protein
MAMHGDAFCARNSVNGHAALWRYESYDGYADELLVNLRCFYSFHRMPNVP